MITIPNESYPTAKPVARILMVAPQPFFQPRGTPFSVLHRIRALLETGYVVDLMTYPFGEDINFPGLTIHRIKRPPFIHDVKIGPSLTKIILDLRLYFATTRALRSERYDVLHSHEEAAFFAVPLARRHGVRHVYDMHSSLPNQLRNFRIYNIELFRRAFHSLERYVLRTCDGIITICPELADIAVKECGPTPHEMIENTADDAKVFTKEPEDIRHSFNLEGKKIVLYTGTFEAYQGLDILLGAFGEVRSKRNNIHLLMVGGRSDQIDHYRKLTQSFDIEDVVTFVGSVHPSRIPAFLEATDIIVSPRSHGTYTPLKIYGYMRSHRPLVATDLPTHTQTLDATMAHFVPPTKEGLASGIQRILDDPEYGARLAKAAVSNAHERFSDAAYVQKVADLYNRVMSPGSQKQPNGPMVVES